MSYGKLSRDAWTATMAPSNLRHLDPEHRSFLGQEGARLLMEQFDDSGNFKFRNFDPYRTHDSGENKELRDFFFDEQGDLREELKEPLTTALRQNDYRWNSDIVMLHYAEAHGSMTNGSYPAIWHWK